jgi:hypothetical protein
MPTSTFHTYPDLLIDGGRLAATQWPGGSAPEAVAATLRLDPEAVILRVVVAGQSLRALAPGGFAG